MDGHGYAPCARMYLATLRYSVSPTALLNDPRLCTLAVEDAVWRAAQAYWLERAPRRWQWRKRRRWAAEEAELMAERAQLHDLARSLGLPVVVGG